MSALEPQARPRPLLGGWSLRRLEWAAILLPLAFLSVYYYLMVGPLHAFFHSWLGFGVLLALLAVAVWAFSRAVFRVFRRMQAEIEDLHEKTQALLVEGERQHLAREMHDGLAQVLSFVNTKAQAVELHLSRGDSVAAREHMAELAEAARKVYADIREGIVALRVEGGEQRDLHRIIDEYVEEFQQFARLPVDVAWDVGGDDLQLSPVVEVQVLRIVQEALTNVRRHAHAGRAQVTFAAVGDTLDVSVRDDGRGFDPGRISRGEWPQFGLRSMRERAESAGGDLRVESAPGCGTVVAARFPGVVRAPEAVAG